MNYRMTSFILGRMLGVEALVMVIPAIVSAIYGEETMRAFLITSAVLMVLFLIFGRKKPENAMIYAKEGFVIVALAWILWSVFGALPFYISGTIPKYIDALFETVSGFTTTGSTILTDIASLPMGMNFWRCLTHWIGGMGVLVFVLVLTSLDDKNTLDARGGSGTGSGQTGSQGERNSKNFIWNVSCADVDRSWIFACGRNESV